MAATGSKDIAVTELFVPERRALPLRRCRGGCEHPGAALNAGPLYRIPLVAASSHPLAPAALGAAEGAYELFLDAMARRVGTYTGARVADFQAVQIKVARARCLIDAARALLRDSAIAFHAIAERNEGPELETKLRFRAHSAFAVSQSREAVEALWSCYGAQGLYTRDPLQRHLRDLLAINQHFSFNFDIAGAAYGALALGGQYANPTMLSGNTSCHSISHPSSGFLSRSWCCSPFSWGNGIPRGARRPSAHLKSRAGRVSSR